MDVERPSNRSRIVVVTVARRVRSTHGVYLGDTGDRRHRAWRCRCARRQRTGCTAYISDKAAPNCSGRRRSHRAYTGDRRRRRRVRTAWRRRPRAGMPYTVGRPSRPAAVGRRRYYDKRRSYWTRAGGSSRADIDLFLSVSRAHMLMMMMIGPVHIQQHWFNSSGNYLLLLNSEDECLRCVCVMFVCGEQDNFNSCRRIWVQFSGSVEIRKEGAY